MSDDERERKHGINAAGAGDLGPVGSGQIIGPCPACEAPLATGEHVNPHTGRMERTLMHPVPFCAYFGRTEAHVIELEIVKRRNGN